MSETSCNPDGVKVEIADGPYVILKFAGCDSQPIRLEATDCRAVAGHMQSAADRAKAGMDFEDTDD